MRITYQSQNYAADKIRKRYVRRTTAAGGYDFCEICGKVLLSRMNFPIMCGKRQTNYIKQVATMWIGHLWK